MSSDEIIISATQVSKCYPIYAQPKDRLKQYVMPPLQRAVGAQQRQYFKEFWALRDISFEIKRGDTVGIIGRNGAGKSTLLQVLCGTLSPTSGEYFSKGRVAALLELGSGFNPEFSGRENVYLNASILGLTKAQIDDRFDSIAAFADIGEFIEQPVKTYSSGMYVRLAFAVIAHVDADILVVDEALAVGDAIFTQKCMRYIRSFQERGTLLFVSHDISSVQNLCKSALWLDGGRVRMQGTSKTVSEAYLQFTLQQLYGSDIALQEQRGADQTNDSDKDIEINERAAVTLPEVACAVSVVTEPQMANSSILKARAILDYGVDAEVVNNLFAANGFFTGDAEITSVSVKNLSSGAVPGIIRGWDRLQLTVRAKTNVELVRPIIGFLVRDRLGQDLLGENTLISTAQKPATAKPGQELVATFECVLPMLRDGDYTVMCSIADGDRFKHVQHHWMHDALLLHVHNSHVQYGLVGVPFTKIALSIED